MSNEHIFILERKNVGDVVEIDGEFSHYLYEKPDSDYVIAVFETIDYYTFLVSGNIPFQLTPYRSYDLKGEIIERKNNRTDTMERQLRIIEASARIPKGGVQITKFLGNITGLTVANYIYEKYRDETIDIIQYNPERVAGDFKNVSLETAQRLQAEVLRALSDVSEAAPFLQSYGFSLEQTENLINLFGEEIKNDIEEFPYILMNNEGGYPGASFRLCDRIARDIKYDLTDIRRIKAGITYALEREGNSGHIYFSLEDTLKHGLSLLNYKNENIVNEERIKEAIVEMIEEKLLHHDIENGRIYLKEYYDYEKNLAFNLVAHHSSKEWIPLDVRKKLLKEYLESEQIKLEKKQIEAVLTLSKHRSGVSLLMGGAGTGKTFTIKVYLELMSRMYEQEHHRKPVVELMAPTGKAAKVMKATTSLPTSTVHRGLGWTPTGFRFNEANPLSADIIIVDEASMLDTYMAYSLTRAVPLHAKVILMGDPNQLPSIGAGNVLHDISDSQLFAEVVLDVPKRQDAKGYLAMNGALIANQKPPLADTDTKDPRAIIKLKKTPKDIVEQMKQGLKYLLHKGIAADDIQVISPGRKGVTGIYNLNLIIQDIINPKRYGEHEVLNTTFYVNGKQQKLFYRKGDRVIHTTNTNNLQWVTKIGNESYRPVVDNIGDTLLTNGEIGKIVDVFSEEYNTQSGRRQKRNIIVVQYDDGLILYHNDDIKDLDHGFAMTIHKSQGSQWRAVIQILSSEHTRLLDNSLMYTGYTRAEEYQILLADPRAFETALKTRRTFERRTTLTEQIQEETKFN